MRTESYDDLTPEIIYFIHRKCSPNWKIEECVTNCIDVIYVISGASTYKIAQQYYRIEQGDLLCIPMGSIRSAVTEFENFMECFSVSFRLHDAFGTAGLLPLPLVSHIGIHPDIVSLYGDLNDAWLRRSPGYRMKSKAILLLILQRYYELILYKYRPAAIDPRINKAVRFITDHYFEEITINDVSELTRLNSNYFGVLFKRSTGLTFRQFLTSIRINYAENLLKIGEYNVAEIAALCGFSDAYYFSNVYKKSRGIPPSKVRNCYLNKLDD